MLDYEDSLSDNQIVEINTMLKNNEIEWNELKNHPRRLNTISMIKEIGLI